MELFLSSSVFILPGLATGGSKDVLLRTRPRKWGRVRYTRSMAKRVLILIFASIAFGTALGYFFGYDHGKEQGRIEGVSSFADCKEAGYPIMESYPEQCMTPDGRSFPNPEQSYTPEEGGAAPSPLEPVSCTLDAKICSDGSAVGRVAPDCEFAPCPGE
jgi:hypothetical protein